MKLLVFTSPREGRDEEYNQWYAETHIPDMLAIPGVTSASRYRQGPVGSGVSGAQYLAVYDIDGDAGAVMKEIGARSADGRFRLSDSLDPKSALVTTWEAI